MTAVVNKIIPFSCVDGPGNRTAIFLQGCGFACKYCHNPETINLCQNCGACVSYCKTGALRIQDGKVRYEIQKCVLCDECIHHCPHNSSPRTREMTPEQVMQEVHKNIPFIRGITVSGGECTRWPEFLLELLTLAKESGLTTLLDSNGSYDFSADSALLQVTDGVMLDIKALTPAEHIAVTGQNNATVLKNLRFLAKVGKLAEVRTVIVPELFDCRATVKYVSRFLAEIGGTEIRYKIIRYRSNGVRSEYRGLLPPAEEQLSSLRTLAQGYGLQDVVII